VALVGLEAGATNALKTHGRNASIGMVKSTMKNKSGRIFANPYGNPANSLKV
jgi:hypothetical protein